MVGLTINQPYASLLALGAKRYETRSWATKYRGPIAIHAGKKDPAKTISASKMLSDCVTAEIASGSIPPLNNLPTGAIIAIGELVNIWRIVYFPGANVDVARAIPLGAESITDKHDPHFGDFFIPTAKEMAYGHWLPGNYAWEIAITEILTEPIPYKGQLGLWKAPL